MPESDSAGERSESPICIEQVWEHSELIYAVKEGLSPLTWLARSADARIPNALID